MNKDCLEEQKRPESIVDDDLTRILRQVAIKLLGQGPKAEIERREIELPQQTNGKAFNSRIH